MAANPGETILKEREFFIIFSLSKQEIKAFNAGLYKIFPNAQGVGVNLTIPVNYDGAYNPGAAKCRCLVDIAVLQKRIDIAEILVNIYGAAPTEVYKEALLQHKSKELDALKTSLRSTFVNTQKNGDEEMSGYTFFCKAVDALCDSENKFLNSLQAAKSVTQVKELVSKALDSTFQSEEFNSKVLAVQAKIKEFESAPASTSSIPRGPGF